MDAKFVDEGTGPAILVVHGGMGDADAWRPVTDLLKDRFRTVRLHRRQYRMELTGPFTMAEEVEHVTEVARTLEKPLLVGHSSGAVLALEALVAAPGRYSGAVLYEPPLVIGPPLGGQAQAAARLAVTQGHPGRAMAIFLRDIVRMPAWQSWPIGLLIGRDPQWASRVPRQLDDNDAIDGLGVRLDAYAGIDIPVLLMGGDKSPRHLSDRMDALQKVLPRVRRVTMHGQGHAAEHRAPGRVAAAITKFVEEDVSPPTRS